MLTVDLCVMTMINNYHKILTICLVFLITSCETLQDIAGLTKPNLEKDISDELPELVLPPDFNRVAKRGERVNTQIQTRSEFRDQYQFQNQSVRPPKINIESSPTPSDSLEKFKVNKKFSIGEWVYGRYVQGFKEGNLYYKPIYDKGYNFSRRYIPDQNISSFLTKPQNNINETRRGFRPSQEGDIRSLDNLPIID